MANKFYYNGKLIRTSENHIYTHALINGVGKVVTCSATFDGCLKEKNRRISQVRQMIANLESKKKALQMGKAGYYVKDGRHTYYERFDPTLKCDTLDGIDENLNWYNERIDFLRDNDIIVELEMR